MKIVEKIEFIQTDYPLSAGFFQMPETKIPGDE